jgi:tRNA pseudouridine(38-40) synthase
MVENPTLSFSILPTGPYVFPWRCAFPCTKSSIRGRFTLTPSSYSRCCDDRSIFVGRRATQCFNARHKSVDATPNHVSYKNSTNGKSMSFIFETASLVVDHFLSPAPVIPASDSNEHHPLRRIVDDNYLVPPDWIGQMFTPLYGISELSCPPCEASIRLGTKIQLSNGHRKRSQRTNLKITVAYRGIDFCGWEDQRHYLYRSSKNFVSSTDNLPNLPSVQGTLADILDPILAIKDGTKSAADDSLNDESEQAITEYIAETSAKHHHSKPIEIKVAGRTDAGVSAIGQICRIRTRRAWDDGMEKYLEDYVNEQIAKTGSNGPGLRIQSVECVGDDFHPTFGATCRAYAYLFDLPIDDNGIIEECRNKEANIRTSSLQTKSSTLVQKMNVILQALEGKELDYIALSYGKVKSLTTVCTLYHARANIVECVCNDDDTGTLIAPKKRAICIELVGDRFLRRMVRILVATAFREAKCADCDPETLLNILLVKDRNGGAYPAPPDGLTFIGARFDKESQTINNNRV